MPGVFLVIVGFCILAVRMSDHFGYFIPYHFHTWPMILIGVGIFVGLSDGFRGMSWAILVIIGGAFLTRDMLPDWNFDIYIWPLGVILIGLLVISGNHRRHYDWNHWKFSKFNAKSNIPPFTGSVGSEEWIEVTAVLGRVNKTVFSKQFKGGDVTNVLGESLIDLSHADFTGEVFLDLTSVLSNTRLILPSHWTLQSDMTAFLGGVKDNRIVPPAGVDPRKVLVLDGTNIMGSIIISN